jgi:hypothetical protein
MTTSNSNYNSPSFNYKTSPYDAPCKDCPERILNCHSSCIKYALYKNNIEAYKSMENINKAFYAYIAEHYRKWNATLSAT